LRRLILLVCGAWVAWWAAKEIAARIPGPPGPSPLDSEHPPGHMTVL
jgi:hypothetical protein